MSPEQLAAAVCVISIVLYAAFGGADFGGGIWTLLARGPRANAQRDALERAIGPVWETNHVWLILLVVTLFVVFPPAYSAIFTALYVPLFLALLGIVARGAAFALRHYGERGTLLNRSATQAFSVASVLTPFTFGLSVGAVSSGKIELSGSHIESGAFAGWLEPFSLACGVIGLLICAFVAAAYMIPRTEGELREDFRRRALAASLALGVATTVALPIAYATDAEFSSRLDRAEVIAAMAVTAALGVATLWALYRRIDLAVSPLAALTVGGIIVAWALGQNPDLILPGLTIEQAAAPSITVRSFLIALPAGAVILVPSLLLLYLTFSRDSFSAQDTPAGH